MRNVLVVSAPVLDSFWKLRLFRKGDKGTDIYSEDETAYTTHNDSTSPVIDQSGPGPSTTSPIQSKKFLDRVQTNLQFSGTCTVLA